MFALTRFMSSVKRLYIFLISAKTVERLIQGYAKKALGFIISWHSLRTTFVSRSVELEQSPAAALEPSSGGITRQADRRHTKPVWPTLRRLVQAAIG